jgi:hypothetical protein
MRRGSNAARFSQSGRALRQGQLAAQPRQQPAALGEHQQRRVARLRKLRVDQANREQVAIPLHRVPVRQVRAAQPLHATHGIGHIECQHAISHTL